MRPDTIQRLNEVNRRFYADRASSFDEARKRAWSGFAATLELCRRQGLQQLAVLDLGCGNGRFAHYLLRSWPGAVRYTGIDQSSQLLARARRSLTGRPEVSWRRVDLIEGRLAERERYDLVVAFGLMHHVPGLATRQRVLREALSTLRHGGVGVVTFWQFADRQRFRKKIVPWREQGQYLERGVDAADLDRGDHLLRWGAEDSTVRYCHHASDQEMARLIDTAPQRLLDRFRMDGLTGDLNRYVAFSGMT